MKQWMIIVAVVGAVWLGLRMAAPPAGDREFPARTAAGQPELPPPTTTDTDAAQVFQRAFWRRPTANDKILHAERREWADADGVDRWQWFIDVEPSAELARHLQQDNPFNLAAPHGAVELPQEQVPAWFPTAVDGCKVQQSRDGQMILLFEPEGGRLHATSRGRGFAKAVQLTPPMPVMHAQSSAPGRLPATPPPLPPPP